jgi:hypothetical protein
MKLLILMIAFSDTKCLYHAAEGDPIYPVKFLCVLCGFASFALISSNNRGNPEFF